MSHEFTGKSVEAAIEEGLRELGLDESQVTIEIITKGSRGILGIGSEAARVRITRRPAPAVTAPTPVIEEVPSPAATPVTTSAPVEAVVETAVSETGPVDASDVDDSNAASTERVSSSVENGDDVSDEGPAQDIVDGSADSAEETDASADTTDLEELASGLLSEMLSLMGLDAQVVAAWESAHDEHRTLVLDIQGRDLGVLIGRHGNTLASMQYLLRLMINQRLKEWPSVVVDVEGYKANRKKRLSLMAQRMAEQVMESGQPIALEPMPPADRRLIHLALRDHPSVFTRSVGEDDRRKVQILLKD